MTELIVFGPVILGGAAIAFFGRRLLAGAGLRRRAAVATAVLAAVAAGATWLVFVVDAIFYAIGENGPEYYDFSAYQEYRDLTTDGLWFVPISLGYAALDHGARPGGGASPGGGCTLPLGAALAAGRLRRGRFSPREVPEPAVAGSSTARIRFCTPSPQPAGASGRSAAGP